MSYFCGREAEMKELGNGAEANRDAINLLFFAFKKTQVLVTSITEVSKSEKLIGWRRRKKRNGCEKGQSLN